ncbi:hypothetical protein ATCC90586_006446 [Pythium insidiosum]|nr:hypothetical protein ATCC90586_006446 [Pythium insidiosum]
MRVAPSLVVRVPYARTEALPREMWPSPSHKPLVGVRPTDASRKRPREDVAGAESCRKARKASHIVRREQKQALLLEKDALEERLEAIEREQRERHTRDSARLVQENRCLLRAIQAQQSALANVQAQLLRQQTLAPIHSLKLFIQLGADPEQRLLTLQSLRASALQDAAAFVHERLGPMDEMQPFRTEDRFVDATGDGDFHLSCCDIVHFHGAKSVKQVFDSLAFYLSNMEISISETLGDLTILEDMDALDSRITNRRILSATRRGVIVELNNVVFSELVDGGDAPFAVFAAHSVDDDALHPYRPSERVRKDISAALTLTAFRRRRSENPFLSRASRRRQLAEQHEGDADDDGSELVVVMKRCGFVTLRRPQFEVAPEVLEEMFNALHSWGQVMVSSMRDGLAAANAPLRPES